MEKWTGSKQRKKPYQITCHLLIAWIKIKQNAETDESQLEIKCDSGENVISDMHMIHPKVVQNKNTTDGIEKTEEKVG